MHSKETIENVIRDVIKNITGIENIQKDVSLVDRYLNIPATSFIYLFSTLEETLRLPVNRIFMTHTYEVMTIENLTNVLFEMEITTT